jgi:hypothetical protein
MKNYDEQGLACTGADQISLEIFGQARRELQCYVSVHRGATTTIGLRLPGRRPDMNTALTIDGDAKLRSFERERWEANRLSAAVYQGGSGSREGGVESWK